MTKIEQRILLNQLNTINLAIAYGKLNNDKMTKALEIKAKLLSLLSN